ncbi:hypothetical protein CPSG_07011 [Coccidioides posadasii str. Silveira]|uniref:Uncharacterized protein n=1 Tax=Coccidioides posadasii (strain RMSCC 757 / Silveira) TaxID=443226 RepID=E9DB09_COCPS|nr:hypothetical protein CPSG_07011 [Coccidioides posadasii str. Silveira]
MGYTYFLFLAGRVLLDEGWQQSTHRPPQWPEKEPFSAGSCSHTPRLKRTLNYNRNLLVILGRGHVGSMAVAMKSITLPKQ